MGSPDGLGMSLRIHRADGFSSLSSEMAKNLMKDLNGYHSIRTASRRVAVCWNAPFREAIGGLSFYDFHNTSLP
jgi:hypothetical protein